MTEEEVYEEVVEMMARRGCSDEEWDRESFGYIKTVRLQAKEMLDVLLAPQPDGFPLAVLTKDPRMQPFQCARYAEGGFVCEAQLELEARG